MRSIGRRIERLEAVQGDDFRDTLSVLVLTHKVNYGHPPSVETKSELEMQAREVLAQGIVFSLTKVLKKVDGKGLPLPGGTR